MNKKRILLSVLSLALLIGLMLGIAIPAMAARGSGGTINQSTDWLASSGLDLKKCTGADCAAEGHKNCNYVYSFAVIGDTQNLNIYDLIDNTNNMSTLYQWIADNQKTYNIQYVMGVGDITQAYHDGYAKNNKTYKTPGVDTSNGVWDDEWKHAANALKILDDAGIPYSLVRGNHDMYAGFNGVFGVGNSTFGTDSKEYYNDLLALSKQTDGKDSEGNDRYMAGFRIEGRIEETYRKVTMGDQKYIIVTLDWHPYSKETDCITKTSQLCTFEQACTVHATADDCSKASDKCVIGDVCMKHNSSRKNGTKYCKTELCDANCTLHDTFGWLNELLKDNSDYEAIITMHSFSFRDGSTTDDIEDVFPYENLTGTRVDTWGQVCYDSGNASPKALWNEVLSKHANVKMLFCGHVDEDNIVTTQLKGENNNTVTVQLIDGQTIDSAQERVGLVAMYYMSADGKVAHVEYISTVRAMANPAKPAYLRQVNQFKINLDYGTAWTSTAYGQIPTEIYEKHPFHVILDDDSNLSTVNTLYGSYDTWEETVKRVHELNGVGAEAARKAKTYYIVMSKNATFSNTELKHNQQGDCVSKVVFDMNGKTLTLATGTKMLPYYNATKSKQPSFTITNGNIIMQGTATMIVTQHGHKNATDGYIDINLNKLNITYDSNGSGPIVNYYVGSTGGPSNVNLTLTDCKIDSSASTNAVTLFKFADDKQNSDVRFEMKGGSIIGSTAANLTPFTQNPGDTVIFSKSNGSYPTLTLSENTAPYATKAYYSETENKFLEFGAPTESSGKYVYPLVTSNKILTKYGAMPSDYANVDTYPFAVFNNDEFQTATNNWQDLFNKTLEASALRSGSYVLLRKDIATKGDTWFLSHINDVFIDLGGFTYTISGDNAFMFHARGREATAYTSKVTVTNGKIKNTNGLRPVVYYSNESTNTTVDTFDFIFNGVKFDISAGGYTDGACIVGSNNGGAAGAGGSVTLNDCEIIRGNSTATAILFDLQDGNSNIKNDITVTVNGGKLTADSIENLTIANYDAARDGKVPDALYFGKGSNGKSFEVVLPASASIGSATYEFTKGAHRLAKLADNSDGTTSYNFDYVDTEYGVISQTYASIENYPIVVFYNGTLVGGYSSYKSAINAAVGKIDTAAEIAVCKDAYVVLRKDFVVSEDSYFSGARGNLIVDLQGFTLSSSTNGIAGLYLNYSTATADFLGYTSNFNIKNGTIVNNRADLPIIAIDQGGTTSLTGVSAKKLYFSFDNVTFKTSKSPVLHNYEKSTVLGIDVTVKCNECTFDFTGAANNVAFISLVNNTVQANIEITNCSVIADNYNNHPIYKIGSNDTATFSKAADGTYLTITQSTATAPTTAFVTTDGGSAEYTLISSDTENKKYVYALKGDPIAEPPEGSGSGGELPDVEAGIEIPGYGIIPADKKEYADAQKYPFLVFKDNECIGAAEHWFNLIEVDVKGGKYQEGCTVLLRRDYITTEANPDTADTNNKKNPSYFAYIDTMTIDLGGFTFTRGGWHMFQLFGTQSTAHETEITVKNGTIKTASNTAPFALNNANTNTNADYFKVTVENVTFDVSGGSGTQGVLVAFGDGTAQGFTIDFILNDCTIYRGSSTRTMTLFSLIDEKSGKTINKTDVNVVINGGSLVTDTMAGITFATYSPAREGASASADTFTIGKSPTNGSSFMIKLDKSAVAPTSAYALTDGDFSLVKVGEDSKTACYVLQTEATAKASPLVLYKDDKSANDKDLVFEYTAFGDAYTKLAADLSATYNMILRDDMTKTTKKYIGNFQGVLTIDLGGKTLTIVEAGNYLFDMGFTGQNGLTAQIAIENGTVVKAGGRGVVCINYDSNLKTKDCNVEFNFNDVTFRSTDNTYNKNVIFTTWEGGYDGATACVRINSVFEDCVFDLGGSIDGAVMFALNHSSNSKDRVVHSVTVKGGKIIADSATQFDGNFVKCDTHTEGRVDTLVFEKLNGNYTELEMPADSTAPASEFNGLKFAQKSTDGTTTTYVLVPTASIDLDFKPMASVTLDSNLIFNIYIPAHAGLGTVTLDGAPVNLGEAKGGYYLVSVELPADEAAREIKLVANLEVDGTSLSGTFTFSTVKYAQKLLADGSISDTEKALAKDMLNYIDSAYKHFNGDAVLDAPYASGFNIASAEAKKTVPGLSGATFVLDAKPAVRFYFADGYSYESFTFKVGNRILTEKDIAYKDAAYVEFSLYAYEMTEDFTYTVGGESGAYNLASYYAYASGTGENDYKGEDKATLTDLVAKFYNYCASAKAYRASVIGK